MCGFPLTLSSSDTKYLELVKTPQVKGSAPPPYVSISDASSRSQVVTCISDQLAVNGGVLATPSSGLIICLKLTEFREMPTSHLLVCFTGNMREDIHKELHLARSRSALSSGVLSLRS